MIMKLYKQIDLLKDIRAMLYRKFWAKFKYSIKDDDLQNSIIERVSIKGGLSIKNCIEKEIQNRYAE